MELILALKGFAPPSLRDFEHHGLPCARIPLRALHRGGGSAGFRPLCSLHPGLCCRAPFGVSFPQKKARPPHGVAGPDKIVPVLLERESELGLDSSGTLIATDHAETCILRQRSGDNQVAG
jgi:hypothetical protein